jgi:alkanesulfonate monooxygenase SsuD/methylene tetrahydromethanopterin reductase-like flavin-dependent oxidoreductase (luciferase family)
MHFSNTGDWDRFEARERGQDVPGLPAIPDWVCLAEDMRIAELTEELGFDSLWSVEHHVTPYQMAPNPLQFLTYMAGRTSRIDLGTMVVVLPWYQPLRLAEQAVFLQEVLGEDRTLRLGVGRGLGRREYAAFDVDMEESRPRFQETLDIVKLALTQDRFSYNGEIYTVPPTELRPHPRDGQRIVDNMCCAWGSAKSVASAAENGLRPLLLPLRPREEYCAELAEYNRVRARCGFTPTRPTAVLWAYCDASQSRAQEAAERYIGRYVDTVYRHYEFFGSHFDKLTSYAHYAGRAKQARATGSATEVRAEEVEYMLADHMWGTPDQCVKRIEDMVDRTGCDELILHVAFGGMPIEQALGSMRLIASDVLPALREMR